MTYAETLASFLEEKGMTSADIARTLGLPRSSINYYMHDKHEPTLGRAKEICDVLGITLQEFADRMDGK